MKFGRLNYPHLEPAPQWWRVSPEAIGEEMAGIRRGRVDVIARTPLNHPVYRVVYHDEPAEEKRQSNWSSASYSTNCRAYQTRCGMKQTVCLLAGIHGAEPEGVAGCLNVISLLERGCDLRGQENPELLNLLRAYRLVILPCVNMDGRAVSPDHLRGCSFEEFRNASQGSWADGSLIGWLGSKEYFPLPLERVRFPGGYPNSEGYNIMHDASPGNLRTAEAKGVLETVEAYEVDFLLNLHSGSEIPMVCAPGNLNYPENIRRGRRICRECHTALMTAGLRPSVSELPAEASNALTLNTLITLASGALALTVELPARGPATFDERLEAQYVILKTALADGLRTPFADRERLIHCCSRELD